MIGAGALKAGRAIRRRHRPQTGSDALLGAVAAFASTLAGTRLGGRSDARRGLGVSGSLMPFVAYRAGHAGIRACATRRFGAAGAYKMRAGRGAWLRRRHRRGVLDGVRRACRAWRSPADTGLRRR